MEWWNTKVRKQTSWIKYRSSRENWPSSSPSSDVNDVDDDVVIDDNDADFADRDDFRGEDDAGGGGSIGICVGGDCVRYNGDARNDEDDEDDDNDDNDDNDDDDDTTIRGRP